MEGKAKYRILILHRRPSPQRAALFDRLAGGPIAFEVMYWVSEGHCLATERIHELYPRYSYSFLLSRNTRLRGFLREMVAALSVLRHLLSHKYDGIVGCGYSHLSSWAALFFSLICGIPYMHTTGSTIESTGHQNSPVHNLLRRYVVKHSTVALCYTEDSVDLVIAQGMPQQRAFNVRFGVDTEWISDRTTELGLKRDELKAWLSLGKPYWIGHIGRLVRRKGVIELLKAFEILRRSRQDVGLLYVGDGDLAEEIRRIAQDRAIPDVIVRPSVDYEKVMEYYAAIDVFALLSWHEPSSNATQEAVAAGLPMVATETQGGIRARVRHGCNGFLVPLQPIDAVAQCLNDALELGRSAQFDVLVDRFVRENSAAESAKLYQSAVLSALLTGNSSTERDAP